MSLYRLTGDEYCYAAGALTDSDGEFDFGAIETDVYAFGPAMIFNPEGSFRFQASQITVTGGSFGAFNGWSTRTFMKEGNEKIQLSEGDAIRMMPFKDAQVDLSLFVPDGARVTMSC